MRLRHNCGVPVAQRRVLQPQLSLHIALLEELLQAPRGPLVVDVPALGRVGHVAGVQQQAQHLGLVEEAEILLGIRHS